MSAQARDYGAGAEGARSNVSTQMSQAPALLRSTPDGDAQVRFDGFVEPNGPLIDRKISVPTFPKSKLQAQRQSQPLRENGMTGRWEVSTEAERIRAQRMFQQLGITNIDVSVGPLQ